MFFLGNIKIENNHYKALFMEWISSIPISIILVAVIYVNDDFLYLYWILMGVSLLLQKKLKIRKIKFSIKSNFLTTTEIDHLLTERIKNQTNFFFNEI